MKTNIKPLFDNVLIKSVEPEVKTSSGIFIPDNAKEKPQIGEVIAVGPGNITPKGIKIEMIVKVGQKVMFKKWGGDEVKSNGEEMMIVKQTDILAIIES